MLTFCRPDSRHWKPGRVNTNSAFRIVAGTKYVAWHLHGVFISTMPISHAFWRLMRDRSDQASLFPSLNSQVSSYPTSLVHHEQHAAGATDSSPSCGMAMFIRLSSYGVCYYVPGHSQFASTYDCDICPTLCLLAFLHCGLYEQHAVVTYASRSKRQVRNMVSVTTRLSVHEVR